MGPENGKLQQLDQMPPPPPLSSGSPTTHPTIPSYELTLLQRVTHIKMRLDTMTFNQSTVNVHMPAISEHEFFLNPEAKYICNS